MNVMSVMNNEYHEFYEHNAYDTNMNTTIQMTITQ